MPFAQNYVDVLTKEERTALEASSEIVIDHGLTDLESLRDGADFDDTFLSIYLPQRYLHRYDEKFTRYFLFCLYTVGWKLAQPQPTRLASLAEELAGWVIMQNAKEYMETVMELKDVEDAYGAFTDAFYEDTDFLFLYDPFYDGIDESELAPMMGIASLAFKDWFQVYRPSSEAIGDSMHPYLQDEIDTKK